jgi:hypothetical protein
MRKGPLGTPAVSATSIAISHPSATRALTYAFVFFQQVI